jgi:glycosyltransferase involved in cell wall biosynthesis
MSRYKKAKENPFLVIFVNRDSFFLSHFLSRSLTAAKAGYLPLVLCPNTGSGERILAKGLGFIPVEMQRQGISLFAAFRTLFSLVRIYRETQPKVVWHIGLKPIVLGSLAARIAGVRGVVNAPVGMGFVFASNSRKARLLRPVIRRLLRVLLNPPGSKVVFENADDLREMQALGAVRAPDAVLIRGAGVNVHEYVPAPEPQGVPVVLFAARLIWEKGVAEFVEAARLLRARGVSARFQIAGGVDHDSASAVPESQLRQWVEQGCIEWLGAREDMPQVLAGSTLFCLPSWYREGLPKVILEAMACARAVVTTDTAGCREAVTHMDNGLLVPPKDSTALADAIEILLNEPALRWRLAKRGRERACNEFATEIVCDQTLSVFNSVVPKPEEFSAKPQRPR